MNLAESCILGNNIHSKAEELNLDNPGLTEGQALMMALEECAPDVYKQIINTKNDPSYDTDDIDRIAMFWYAIGALTITDNIDNHREGIRVEFAQQRQIEQRNRQP